MARSMSKWNWMKESKAQCEVKQNVNWKVSNFKYWQMHFRRHAPLSHREHGCSRTLYKITHFSLVFLCFFLSTADDKDDPFRRDFYDVLLLVRLGRVESSRNRIDEESEWELDGPVVSRVSSWVRHVKMLDKNRKLVKSSFGSRLVISFRLNPFDRIGI